MQTANIIKWQVPVLEQSELSCNPSRSLVSEHARYTRMTPETLRHLLCSRMQSDRAAVAVTRDKVESTVARRLASGDVPNKTYQSDAK
jgi:hypothetical protein